MTSSEKKHMRFLTESICEETLLKVEKHRLLP